MTVVDAQAWSRLAERLELVQERLVTNVQNHARIRNKLSDGIDTEVARQRALQESAIVRLGARLESQPVIEQAKGILMGRSGCSDDEAFDILRRASQRSNLRVREIAAKLVADAAQKQAAMNHTVTPRRRLHSTSL